MGQEVGAKFETPEQAWGVVELGLKNYPDAGADREQRVGAVRKIAEGTRQYFLLKGDRQAMVDRVGQMELPVTLLGDTDLALGELGKRYVENGNRLEEGDWSFFEGMVDLREAIEAGKADDPGVTQEFKDRTQSVKGWLAREKRGRAGEVMRRVTRRREAAPPVEPPGPPDGEAVPAGGGSEKDPFWYRELGDDLPVEERDREVTDKEIVWLFGEKSEEGESRGRFDQKNPDHINRAYNIAVRAARELFFGYTSETGLAWKGELGKGNEAWGFRKEKVVPHLRRILELWGRQHGDIRPKVIFDMAWVLHEMYFGPLRDFQYGQGDIRKQAVLERGLNEDVPFYLKHLVEMISEEETVEGWGEGLGKVMEEKKDLGIKEAEKYLRSDEGKKLEDKRPPRFAYVTNETDDYGNLRVFKLLENRFLDVFMKKGEVKTLWQPGVDLLDGQDWVKLALDKDKDGNFLYEGKPLASMSTEVRDRVKLAREAVRQAIEFRGGVDKLDMARQYDGCALGDIRFGAETGIVRQVRQLIVGIKGQGNIDEIGVRELSKEEREELERRLGEDRWFVPGTDELMVGEKRIVVDKMNNEKEIGFKYECKNDGEYVIPMSDWLRQSVAMTRSLFGIPRVYKTGTYEVMLPNGLKMHVRAKIKMPWRDQPPWSRKFREQHEGNINRKDIEYVDSEEELLHDIRGEEGGSTRPRYSKALFDCPQVVTFPEYRRLKLSKDTSMMSYWEDQIRKAQGFRSKIMYDWRARLQSTWEFPLYGAYDPDVAPFNQLLDREYGLRRDILPRQRELKSLPEIGLRYIYPDTEKGSTFNEDIWPMLENPAGCYDEQRLLALGFSADRAREVSRITAPRYEMVNRMQQIITDYWLLNKAQGLRHAEARLILGRGPEGMNEAVRLMKDKRMAGWVFQKMFEQAGMTVAGWEDLMTVATPEDKARLFLMYFSAEQLFWLFHYEDAARADWGPQEWYDMMYYIATTLNLRKFEYKEGREVEIDEASVLSKWQANIDAIRRGEKVKLVAGMTNEEKAWFNSKSNRMRLEAVDRIQRMRARDEWGREKEDDGTLMRYPLLFPIPSDDKDYKDVRSLFADSRGAQIALYKHDLDFPFTHLESPQDLMAVMDYIILRKYGFFNFENRPLHGIGWLNMAEIMLREYLGKGDKHSRDKGFQGGFGEYHQIPDSVATQIRKRSLGRSELERTLYPKGVVIPEEPQFVFRYGDRWEPKEREFVPELFGDMDEGRFRGYPVGVYEFEKEKLKWKGGHIGVRVSLGDASYSDWWLAHNRFDWPDSVAGAYARAGLWLRTLARFDWYTAETQFGPRGGGDYYHPWQISPFVVDPWGWGASPGNEGRPRWPFEAFGFKVGKPKASVFFQVRHDKIISPPIIRGLEVVGAVTNENAKDHARWRYFWGIPDQTGEIGAEDIISGIKGSPLSKIPVLGELLGAAEPKTFYGLTISTGLVGGAVAFSAIALGGGVSLAGLGLGLGGGLVGFLVTAKITDMVVSMSQIRETLAAGKVWGRDTILGIRVRKTWDSVLDSKNVYDFISQKLIGGRTF